MKEVYLAYFDFLGFKEFIQKSTDDDILMGRMRHIFRDIEMALSKRKFLEPKNGIILNDLSDTKINSLNISDTVLFWTKDCNIESLKELIITAYEFNWSQNLYNFPARGSIVKGKIEEVSGRTINSNESSYSVQCLYGEGLVFAHEKAESQDWAGTVIDNKVIEDLLTSRENQRFITQYAMLYDVPYKENYPPTGKEYVLLLGKPSNHHQGIEGIMSSIDYVFKLDNKSIDHPSVIQKIKNTKAFVDAMHDL